jgi:hypothetical protein
MRPCPVDGRESTKAVIRQVLQGALDLIAGELPGKDVTWLAHLELLS